MPAAPPNTTLRIIVPIIAAALGVAVIYAGYRNSAKQPSNVPSAPTAATQSAPAAPEATKTVAGSTEPAPSTSEPAPATSAAQPEGAAKTESAEKPAAAATAVYRARVYPEPEGKLEAIGDIDPATGYTARVTFTLGGAGVESITMADFYKSIDKTERYEVQQAAALKTASGASVSLTSLAARQVEIGGVPVDLYGDVGARVWRATGPGRFEAEILGEGDRPVLRLKREYSLAKGSYEIMVRQTVENLTDGALPLVWRQYGPLDLADDKTGYGLDVRRVRFGAILEATRDPSRQIVEADRQLLARATVVSRAMAGDQQLWPRHNDYKGLEKAVWLAQTSRYFAFAVHPLVGEDAARANLGDPSAHPLNKAFVLAEQAHAVVWAGGAPGEERVLVQLTSAPMVAAPKATLDLSFGAYAGPLGRRQLSVSADPMFGALGLDDLVIYNIGGPCAFCTFQPLARGMLWFLTILHDHVLHDWALAIMVLVVCVRSVLHPLTRRSQISLARFSKQMAALAPKQQKIREKFKDDPKRMQAELVALMKEEKVSYTGMLGCLPMFLQMPIWIALYAMLYFSFDLRHAPAFYGLFQAASGGNWSFLADLSAADHFVYFGGKTLFTLPLMGHITGLNVLPLILGVVFFIQQKYLTPPPSAAMTPEQETQQKIMKVMTVVLFPVMMYNAPSGLAIYFITNSTLGILESRYIRSHISQLDLLKKPDDGGRKKVENTAGKR